jgi:hemerythrin
VRRALKAHQNSYAHSNSKDKDMLEYPQVALAFMNHDHAEFVEMRGQLLAALSGEGAIAEVDALLDRLMEHTRTHFGEEERQMREAQFPPYPMHKGEHDRVLAEMEARVAEWKQGRDAEALRGWLDKDVGDWFVNHVGMMDFVTARFIAATQE